MSKKHILWLSCVFFSSYIDTPREADTIPTDTLFRHSRDGVVVLGIGFGILLAVGLVTLLQSSFIGKKSVSIVSAYTNTRFRSELRPRPDWGAYNAPSDQLAGWEGGLPFPLNTFGFSISAPLCLGCQAPNTNSWFRLWPTPFFLVYNLKKHGTAPVLLFPALTGNPVLLPTNFGF